MDWNQLIYSCVGAFLGFGFALLTEALVNNKKQKIEINKIKNNIIDELQNIEIALSENQESDKPIYFETPVWKSIISTGMLLSLLKVNKELYTRIITVYDRIHNLKMAENKENRNAQTVKTLRIEVIEEIEGLIKS